MGLRDDIIISFGEKYKGKSVSETPSSFLRWCLEQPWFERKHEELIEVFEEELNWRTDYRQHFEDPEDIRY